MNEGGRRYRIIGVLGRGGFGTVYRAELLGEGGFSRAVALKVLNAEVAGLADVAERLRDEARLLGLLRHRAILQVDGLVRLDGRWTVVMEYVEGVDLAALVGRGPTPAGVALEVISEVASALHVAYQWPGPGGEPLCLLHRDIKPSNILVTAAGEVKVLDFGIARAEFDAREAKTKSVMFGSPGYIAPERLDFIETPAGDVYSIGVVLHELLTGVSFGKTVGRAESQARQVRQGRARLDAAGVPPEVSELLGRMLAYEVEDRPSARDIERACREVRGRVAGPWLRDWAEETIPGMLVGRGLGGEHDFSDAVVSERSGPAGSETIALELEGPAPAPVARLTGPAAPERAPSPVEKPPKVAEVVPANPAPAKAPDPKPVAPKLLVARPKARSEGADVITWLLGIGSVVLVPSAILVFLWFLMICCCGGFGGEGDY